MPIEGMQRTTLLQATG